MPDRIVSSAVAGTGTILAFADSTTTGLNAVGITALCVASAGGLGLLARKLIDIYKDGKGAKLQTDRDRLTYEKEREEFLRSSLSVQLEEAKRDREKQEQDDKKEREKLTNQIEYLQRQFERLLTKYTETDRKIDRQSDKLDKQSDKIEEVKQSVQMQPLVLLVEDDQTTRNALGRILTNAGYQVITSESAAKAIAQLDQKPAAIILDITLEDGPGWPVMIEARKRNLNTKIIVASGREVVAPSIIDTHAIDAVIPKPVNPQKLLEALQDKSMPRPHMSDLEIVAMPGTTETAEHAVIQPPKGGQP